MKRTIRFTAIAAILSFFAVTTVYADTLQDAFKSGKVSGELLYQYEGGDTDVDSNSPGAAIIVPNTGEGRWGSSAGIRLQYVTGQFHGFSAGAAFISSTDIGNPEFVAPRHAVEDTRITQAYLQYSFLKGNSIKIGRQTIGSPLIANAVAGPLQYDSFDAAVLTTTLLPKTVVKLIAINEWQPRDTPHHVTYDDPIYSVFVNNKSITGLSLTGQFMTTKEDYSDESYNGTVFGNYDAPIFTRDGYSTYYLSADYKLPISHPVTLHGQYGGATFEQEGEDDTWFYGLKIETKVAGIGLEACYTETSDKNDFPGTAGHVPGPLYNKTLLTTPFRASHKSYSAGASYAFTDGVLKGLHARGLVLYHEEDANQTASTDDGVIEFAHWIGYDFSGALQGLSVNANGSIAKYDKLIDGGDDDTIQYVRLYVSYKF